MTENFMDVQPEYQLLDQPPQGIVLAFDFGKSRIGVAIGNNMLGIARSLVTIDSEVTCLLYTSPSPRDS